MNAVYFALQGANGYFIIQHRNKGALLIYTTPYNLTKLNLDGVSDFLASEMEIDLHVVDDYDSHSSSGGKQGERIVRVQLKDLGSFERFPD